MKYSPRGHTKSKSQTECVNKLYDLLNFQLVPQIDISLFCAHTHFAINKRWQKTTRNLNFKFIAEKTSNRYRLTHYPVPRRCEKNGSG